MLKKNSVFYISEILPFPKYTHFRKGKKGVLILGNVLILKQSLWSLLGRKLESSYLTGQLENRRELEKG